MLRAERVARGIAPLLDLGARILRRRRSRAATARCRSTGGGLPPHAASTTTQSRFFIEHRDTSLGAVVHLAAPLLRVPSSSSCDKHVFSSSRDRRRLREARHELAPDPSRSRSSPSRCCRRPPRRRAWAPWPAPRRDTAARRALHVVARLRIRRRLTPCRCCRCPPPSVPCLLEHAHAHATSSHRASSRASLTGPTITRKPSISHGGFASRPRSVRSRCIGVMLFQPRAIATQSVPSTSS